VIIPILFDKTKKKVLEAANKIKKELNGFSPIMDDRKIILQVGNILNGSLREFL